MVSSLCAVVVTYHPEPVQLEKLVKAALRQVSCLVVVDNGSCDEALLLIGRLVQDNQAKRLEVIKLGENLGVAAAQNRGIHWARERSCSHVLLLDQDSTPSEDMVSRLLSAQTILSQKYRVAAVGPAFQDPVTGNSVSFTHPRLFKNAPDNQPDLPGCIPVDTLISSGSLIQLEVFEQIHDMDELLFIDTVDAEWCLRAAAKGYQSFAVPDAVLYHSLGDHAHKIWFGRWRHLPQHKPVRYYYMFRNSLLLFRRGYIPFQWKTKSLIKLICLFVVGMFLMPERSTRFRMLVRGLYDGILGKGGRFE
jgi:rhamnosyltransferase